MGVWQRWADVTFVCFLQESDQDGRSSFMRDETQQDKRQEMLVEEGLKMYISTSTLQSPLLCLIARSPRAARCFKNGRLICSLERWDSLALVLIESVCHDSSVAKIDFPLW
jgi:hypothetical protein